MVNKIFALLAMAVCCTSSIAQDSAAPPLLASLKIFRVDSYTLTDKVLRIRLSDRLVSQEVFDNVARSGVCADQWQQPVKFQALNIERIEVLNSADAQGFALLNATSVCKRIGDMKGTDADELFAQQTVRCEAGVCRRR